MSLLHHFVVEYYNGSICISDGAYIYIQYALAKMNWMYLQLTERVMLDCDHPSIAREDRLMAFTDSNIWLLLHPTRTNECFSSQSAADDVLLCEFGCITCMIAVL